MIKVNADYETELFTGGPGPKMVNEAVEFLAFFLVDEAILTQKNYSPEYLNYLEEIAGRKPLTEKSGKAQNWWGSLANIPLERELNSKVTSTQLSIKKGWSHDTFIVDSEASIPQLKTGLSYLVKDPFEMSGRGFTVIQDILNYKKGTLIVEPLLKRKYDFSYYVFPDGKEVVYENLVDAKFQFKGSLFTNGGKELSDLSFYREVSQDLWTEYLNRKQEIVSYYQNKTSSGFSIDSFIYEDNGLKIHALSEVNYRRTMGLTAYEIGKKYFPNKDHWLFTMTKSLKELGGFNFMKTKISHLIEKKKILILSPGDTRFEMFFLAADSREEVLELEKEMMSLLSNA